LGGEGRGEGLHHPHNRSLLAAQALLAELSVEIYHAKTDFITTDVIRAAVIKILRL